MAHALSITDGTTTFSLSTTNCALTQYTPAEPQAKETTVTETIEVLFYAATVTAMRTAINVLQGLIDAARRRTAWGVGPVVYLLYQPDGDATAWRSQLIDVRMEYGEDTLRVWGQAKLTASLVIEREAVREGDEAQIPLTNGNATNNTSGLTVNLHSATGAYNYAQIGTTGVAGSLPTPLRLELTNNTGGSVAYYEVIVSNNAFSTPGSFTPVLQSEVSMVVGGTDTNDATCSNGQYSAATFTNTHTQQYTLSQTLLQNAQGYDFHLLARLRSLTARAFVRPSIYDSTGAFVLWAGDEVELPVTGRAITDFGVIPLPPGGYSSSWGAMRLNLAWRASGAVAVDTDFLAFFPAATYRTLRIPAAVANNATIVDDGSAGRAYVRTSSVELPSVQVGGMPLLVWPGRTQRVYFAWSLADGSAPISQTLSVKAWCRPRRYTF